MPLLRLILVAYFVARCAGSSMGMLPAQMLDSAYAEDPSTARMHRNSHVYQGEGATEDDEVAVVEIDDDFVPALAGNPGLTMLPDGRAPAAPPPPAHRIFVDGVFRPPQATA